jgi:hypothetical protein
MEAVQQFRSTRTVVEGLVFPETHPLINEERFRNLLILERERAELCKRQMLLVQIDISRSAEDGCIDATMRVILPALFSSTRGNDLKGWLDANRMMGIIFPNLDRKTIDIVFNKIQAAVGGVLSTGRYPMVPVSRMIFPRAGQ